jgi:hypothetical protein
MSDEGVGEATTAPDAVVSTFRVVLGAATLLMLALSWRLWIDDNDFPRIPFFRGLPALPVWVSWLFAGTLFVSLIQVTLGIAWRKSLIVSLAALSVLVVQDQNRLQPWIYQYTFCALALAFAPGHAALGLARLFVIAMYVHSGLSKWDESFARFMGPSFVRAGLKPLGIDPSSWNPLALEILVRLMPAGELGIGLGLCAKKTRRLALVASILMHLALIWILSPIGLNQSAIVLVWNAAIIVENVVLFGRIGGDRKFAEAPAPGWLRCVFALAVLLPFSERWQWFDVWPSFAYYASHVESASVWIQGDDSALPSEVQTHLLERDSRPEVDRRLRLTDWSRAVRGVPVYPQNRVANGMAEWLAARGPGAVIRIQHQAPLDRHLQRRSRRISGYDQIRAFGDAYWINAHPSNARRIGIREAANRITPGPERTGG